jgi:N,N'-diacetyllegionaminate synthase
MKEIKIDDKKIGDDNPCFTIAEAGANHDGNLEKAFKLIDNAILAKADSIKFQMYTASKLVTKNAPKYWEDGNRNETQFDVFKKLDSLTEEEWKQIFEYSQKRGITCFSTPFDEKSADFLFSIGVPAFKIASADITHIPLIKHIAKKNIPIFISTGMANDDEIKDAVNTIQDCGNNKIIIMHCITSYPTKPEDANLEIIRTLTNNYSDHVIGYSDHTIGTDIPAFSILYGAKCIEKHFTFDNKLTESPDHRLSLDTKDFLKMVNKIRISEVSKGKPSRTTFDSEIEAVKFARRSIVSIKEISKGTIITKDMIGVKRPATGILPKFFEKIIGFRAVNDIDDDIPLQWDDIVE